MPIVRDALASHYARMGLPVDGSAAQARRWKPLAVVPLTLPNFKWRRAALPIHDVRHVLTGYGCTPAGELETAAWAWIAWITASLAWMTAPPMLYGIAFVALWR